jgi:hypothetical protein
MINILAPVVGKASVPLLAGTIVAPFQDLLTAEEPKL